MDLEREGKKYNGKIPGTPEFPWSAFYLLRLKRLFQLRDAFGQLPPESEGPLLANLLNRAIYSSYCDCLEQKVGDDARKLVQLNNTESKIS